MSECYPCHYSSTALMCMMGSVQAVGFALCVETQWSRWKLGWNIRLFSVAYTVHLFYFISFKFFPLFLFNKRILFSILVLLKLCSSSYLLSFTHGESVYITKYFFFS